MATITCMYHYTRNFETTGNCIVGKPHYDSLSLTEKELLEQAGATIPEIVTFYGNLHLSNNVVITARSRSRTTKRDNSGITYVTGNNTFGWGIVEKLFVLKTSSTSNSYCLISKLLPLSTPLSDDVDL